MGRHATLPTAALLVMTGILLAGCGDAAVRSDADVDAARDTVRADAASVADARRDTAADVPVVRPPDTQADAQADAQADVLPDSAPDARVDAGLDAAARDAAADVGFPLDATYVPILRLDRGTIRYFSLPIGSLRYAVSGWSAETANCVSLIWDFSNTGHAAGAWCDTQGPSFPYVLVRSSDRNDCDDWDYGSDLLTVSASGCVDFAGATPFSVDLVDVDVLVTGPTFTGRIVADDRDRRYPAPTNFGLLPPAGAADEWFVDELTEDGQPGWLTLRWDGAPLAAFDACDLPRCDGTPAIPCGVVRAQARSLGERGGAAWATWDGYVRTFDPERACVLRGFPTATGTYEVTACYGRQRDDEGLRVVSPQCRTTTFTFGVDVVPLTAEAP